MDLFLNGFQIQFRSTAFQITMVILSGTLLEYSVIQSSNGPLLQGKGGRKSSRELAAHGHRASI